MKASAKNSIDTNGRMEYCLPAGKAGKNGDNYNIPPFHHSIHSVFGKTITAFIFLLLCNNISSQTVVAETLQDDLCTAINKLMDQGVKDAFESYKQGERLTIPSKVYTDYYYKSSYTAAGFTEARIKKTITGLNYFTMVYFRDKDVVKSVEKYNELITKVKDCIPKANCTFSDSPATDQTDMKRYEFWTTKAKTGFSPMLAKYFVSVHYIVEKDTQDAVVYLRVGLKE